MRHSVGSILICVMLFDDGVNFLEIQFTFSVFSFRLYANWKFGLPESQYKFS